MIKVNIIQTGKKPEELIANLDKNWFEFQASIIDLGHKTRNKIIDIIKINKKRPQAGEPETLENAIEMEEFIQPASIGFGIGNINKLEEEAPYYLAINYGSAHLVGKRLPSGYFSPGEGKPSSSSFRGGRWKVGGDYSALIKNAIPPMNYIEKTNFWFEIELSKLIKTLEK